MASKQSMDALRKANYVYRERCKIKREIRDGTITVSDVLEGEPYVCDTMSVFELLMSQARWGKGRASKLLAWYPSYPISENRELQDLSPRQKQYIMENT